MRETEEKQKAKKRTVSGVKRRHKETQRDKKRQKEFENKCQMTKAKRTD